MQESRITGAASYSVLEDAFIEEFAAAGGADERLWVLVPTNLLALHLRRRAARQLGGVLGAEFLNLKDAARCMALQALATRGARPLPAGAAELVLQRLLDQFPDSSCLGAFRQFRNSSAAILRAIRLLENCLWTPQTLREAAGSAAFRDASASRRLEELARIWASYRAWKQEEGLFEADDLIALAGREDTTPAERPDLLFLYGFYDFTPAQRALVRRLVDTASRCSAYVLWASEEGAAAPGFEYALPAVQWLQEVLGVGDVTCRAGEADGSDLDRLVRGAFREQPFVAEDEAQRRLDELAETLDGSVRVVDCPGETAEAAELVRETLRGAEGAEGRTSLGVLMRGQETAALAAEAFDRAGVPCFLHEGLPLSRTLAGRIALTLLELATGDAERAAVVDFLGLARIRWPEGMSGTALDRVSREAGIIRGRRAWIGRLRARAAGRSRAAQRAEDEAERRACARDAELCRAASGFLGEFFEKVASLSSTESWNDLGRKLEALVREYSPDDDKTQAVLDVIRGLGALDVTGSAAGPGRCRWALGRQLGSQSLKRGRFRRERVSLSSIMLARGATFDVVIVPGLIEKSFPRHGVPSPLLTEWDREALGGVSARLGCGELPLQQRRPLEERYLFRIALGSARRAVVLTFPRLEEEGDRARLPSRFLLDACSTLAGFNVSTKMLEKGMATGLVRRVPIGLQRLEPEALKRALDITEYDGAVFARMPRGQGMSYMAAVSPFFGRAARLERRRWRRNVFGPYDGKIEAEDLLERLRNEYGRFDSAVSPSRLEGYAACPFHYFLNYLLEIAEIEAPSEELQLPPLERGALIHDLLQKVYAEDLLNCRLGDLEDARVADIVERAGVILDRLGSVHAENHPATWSAEREMSLEQLRALLLAERKDHPDAQPRRFECEFGMQPGTGYPFPLAKDERILFRGRIDRVDETTDGSLRIVDYKTGRSVGYKKQAFAGGRQLQLPIYLLAAAEMMKADVGGASYLFVSEPKEVKEFTLEELAGRMDEFRKAVGLIVEGIAAGHFFPLPARTGRCGRYCPYRIVCGAARESLAEMKGADPAAGNLSELRAIK